MRQLRDGGIYSLALTPYQYTARAYTGVHRATIAWVLVPEWPTNTPISGPALFATHDGILCTGPRGTVYTTSDLDFTGRYKDERRAIS